MSRGTRDGINAPLFTTRRLRVAAVAGFEFGIVKNDANVHASAEGEAAGRICCQRFMVSRQETKVLRKPHQVVKAVVCRWWAVCGKARGWGESSGR